MRLGELFAAVAGLRKGFNCIINQRHFTVMSNV